MSTPSDFHYHVELMGYALANCHWCGAEVDIRVNEEEVYIECEECGCRSPVNCDGDAETFLKIRYIASVWNRGPSGDYQD